LKLSVLIACALLAMPAQAESLLRLDHSSLEQRQIQIREFDSDQKTLVQGCINVLQDIGFKIDNTEDQLGFIQGSRVIEDVEEKGLMSFITKISSYISSALGKPVPNQNKTKVLATIVISPATNKSEVVRVTFIKTKTRAHGIESDYESVIQADIYQAFFSKLNKSLFLEAQGN
jgi:hypothetical protein